MNRTELADLTEPQLRDSYRRCRDLNARFGKTFFLATRLLASDQRPAVHALYGFARRVDDILDDLDPVVTSADREARLAVLARQFRAGDCAGDPVLAAVLHTADRYGISGELFEAFLTSMRMDLTVTDYENRHALDRYVYGSAEVIGLQLLPVLGTIASSETAAPYAASLGKAFQLTNFLRDVDEDLGRGRIYLPADELAASGVDRDLLLWCRREQRVDPRVREALAAQHAITRKVYDYARDGIALLAPRSRPCVKTALTLYAEILDRIEDNGFEVFGRRARVGRFRRTYVGAVGLGHARWARRRWPRRDESAHTTVVRTPR
ncbi:phytoene/squalene synthase family protein [Nocardia vermiculata]|uniref:Phytoene/squalene synthase family protein n=1 Tax=Nocardia vermiculata TaxID=257274 RepID=A0A846Y327_9NOCA|nr:phytoene/squalene synthase family protein [Nocardia vermiculata]NKY52264.1 phytoene/squalene synthase family protein [Nocardia vermiculata]